MIETLENRRLFALWVAVEAMDPSHLRVWSGDNNDNNNIDIVIIEDAVYIDEIGPENHQSDWTNITKLSVNLSRGADRLSIDQTGPHHGISLNVDMGPNDYDIPDLEPGGTGDSYDSGDILIYTNHGTDQTGFFETGAGIDQVFFNDAGGDLKVLLGMAGDEFKATGYAHGLIVGGDSDSAPFADADYWGNDVLDCELVDMSSMVALNGHEGSDTLKGGSGDDVLDGDSGIKQKGHSYGWENHLDGGMGSDRIHAVNQMTDTIIGGEDGDGLDVDVAYVDCFYDGLGEPWYYEVREDGWEVEQYNYDDFTWTDMY